LEATCPSRSASRLVLLVLVTSVVAAAVLFASIGLFVRWKVARRADGRTRLGLVRRRCSPHTF
jgi:hypothetical protein